MEDIRVYLEDTLKEEVLKVTNFTEFQHNVTHEGIINAMQKVYSVGLKKGELLEKLKQKKAKAIEQHQEDLKWCQSVNS